MTSAAPHRARDPERTPLYRFLGPRYWAVWLALGFVRLVNLAAAALHNWRSDASSAASPTSSSRRDRRIAASTLHCACRNSAARNSVALVRQHFEALGLRRVRNRTRVVGERCTPAAA